MKIETPGKLDYIRPDSDGGAQRILARFKPDHQSLDFINRPKSENAIPFSEWHGVTRTYTVGSAGGCPDLPALVEWLDIDGAELLERIANGFTTDRNHWGGRNLIGRLDADAVDAEETLRRYLEDCPALGGIAGVWDVGDWIGKPDELTADTTDAQLLTLAADLEAEARSECVILSGDIARYLTAERERLGE